MQWKPEWRSIPDKKNTNYAWKKMTRTTASNEYNKWFVSISFRVLIVRIRALRVIRKCVFKRCASCAERPPKMRFAHIVSWQCNQLLWIYPQMEGLTNEISTHTHTLTQTDAYAARAAVLSRGCSVAWTKTTVSLASALEYVRHSMRMSLINLD